MSVKMNQVSQAASLLGKIGRGESKRRDVDYAALARLSHKARRRNLKNLRSAKEVQG